MNRQNVGSDDELPTAETSLDLGTFVCAGSGLESRVHIAAGYAQQCVLICSVLELHVLRLCNDIFRLCRAWNVGVSGWQ